MNPNLLVVIKDRNLNMHVTEILKHDVKNQRNWQTYIPTSVNGQKKPNKLEIAK